MTNIAQWPWPVDLARPIQSSPMSGGMICETVRAQLGDGTEAVAKSCSYDPEIEADGLRALADAGAPVPEVLGWTRGDRGGVLVLEYVGAPSPARSDWARLGETLAHVHRDSAQADEQFGWHRDNRIGDLIQPNAPLEGVDAGWGAFYAERRVRAHLDDRSVPDELAQRLHRACDGPLRELLPQDPPVSLIHGDLWSGNVVDGRWLVDPAVQRADRELELAFMALFGGFPQALWDAYTDAWPLTEGWQERRPALQLHHLLVHVRHFEQHRPGNYVRSVADCLARYGW